MEKVSIVVPVYNMGEKIEICVQSLIKQTYENIEIILVDDGSNDDSFKHCLQLEKMDPRIIALHTENCGSGPARNFGLENASGRYIYFPDADDYLEANAISTMVFAMQNGFFDLVVFGYKNVKQNGRLVSIKEYPESEQNADDIRKAYADYMTTLSKWGIQGAPWNKFFDLNVIKNNNIRFPSLRRHQDEGFIGCYMCFATKVHFIPDILYTYYVNDLKKEWQKYPVDYIDAVIGLYEVRKNTILTWNSDDLATHDLVEKEYLCNVIKALELSFSPKFRFNKAERNSWIMNTIQKAGVTNMKIPESIGIYQKIILNKIRSEKYRKVYKCLWLKVFVQKHLSGCRKAPRRCQRTATFRL